MYINHKINNEFIYIRKRKLIYFWCKVSMFCPISEVFGAKYAHINLCMLLLLNYLYQVINILSCDIFM